MVSNKSAQQGKHITETKTKTKTASTTVFLENKGYSTRSLYIIIGKK